MARWTLSDGVSILSGVSGGPDGWMARRASVKDLRADYGGHVLNLLLLVTCRCAQKRADGVLPAASLPGGSARKTGTRASVPAVLDASSHISSARHWLGLWPALFSGWLQCRAPAYATCCHGSAVVAAGCVVAGSGLHSEAAFDSVHLSSRRCLPADPIGITLLKFATATTKGIGAGSPTGRLVAETDGGKDRRILLDHPGARFRCHSCVWGFHYDVKPYWQLDRPHLTIWLACRPTIVLLASCA